MGRKKIGVEQVKFDFAITPKTEHEQFVVRQLQGMKDSNSFSAWIKALIYAALPLSEDRPIVEPVMPNNAPLAESEPTKGKTEQDRPKQQISRTLPKLGQPMARSFSKAEQAGKPANGRRNVDVSDES